MSEATDNNPELNKLQKERDFWKAKADGYQQTLKTIDSIDREFLISAGSMQQRANYHSFARILKRDVIQQREALGSTYLSEHKAGVGEANKVPSLKDHHGLVSKDLSHDALVKAAVKEAVVFFEHSEAQNRSYPSKQSLQFIGSTNNYYTAESAAFKLATSPLFLIPIIEYFGMLPILSGFGLTLAKNEEFFRKSSQRLHMDPEDRTQMKVFLYITDVDTNSGPFMAANAQASRCQFEDPMFILDRMDDDVVARTELKIFTGPAGTTTFCDTCRCLHAGGRPGDRIRLQMSFEYNIPTYLWAPLYDGDGEFRDRLGAIKHAEDDPLMSALLGKSLMYQSI